MADRSYFPDDFAPTKFHVICGRGKKSYGHEGNQWFLHVVSGRINDYARADNKQEKSEIVQKLVAEIRDAGGFIRQDEQTGRYYRVAEGEGRDKVSQALRDALKHKYKSSKDVKRTNRKAKRLSISSIGAARRRDSMGGDSVDSGYYSGGAEAEVVASSSGVALQQPSSSRPSPLMHAVTPIPSAPDMIVPNGRSQSLVLPQMENPNVNWDVGGQRQSWSQPPTMIHRSRSIGAGPVADPANAANWNGNPVYILPPGAPARSQSMGSELGRAWDEPVAPPPTTFPVEAFPEGTLAALGYNEVGAQAGPPASDFTGRDFMSYRRPSTGASSYASTHSGHQSGGSARDYWSGDWDADEEEVDLDFCLNLDDMDKQAALDLKDMEQEAAALGMDFTDLVYASPQRPSTSPAHQFQQEPPNPSPGHPYQQQPSPGQYQLQQPSPTMHHRPTPSPPNPEQPGGMNRGQMQMQIGQMMASTSFPPTYPQQLKQMQNLQNLQNLRMEEPPRLTEANLAAMHAAGANSHPANRVSYSSFELAQARAQQQQQQQQGVGNMNMNMNMIHERTDNTGRIFYDV